MWSTVESIGALEIKICLYTEKVNVNNCMDNAMDRGNRLADKLKETGQRLLDLHTCIHLSLVPIHTLSCVVHWSY